MSRHGEIQLSRLQDLPLEIGDTLLVQGHLRDIDRARQERQVLTLDEVQAPVASSQSWIVILTLLAVLLGAALTDQPLAILGLAGAMVLVLTRVIRPDEVPRVIDFKVIALVGGMLSPWGAPSRRLASTTSSPPAISNLASDSLSPQLILAVILTVTMLLTQVLNNVLDRRDHDPGRPQARGVPGRLARAHGHGRRGRLKPSPPSPPSPTRPTPWSMGPGGYKYRDFLRVGRAPRAPDRHSGHGRHPDLVAVRALTPPRFTPPRADGARPRGGQNPTRRVRGVLLRGVGRSDLTGATLSSHGAHRALHVHLPAARRGSSAATSRSPRL